MIELPEMSKRTVSRDVLNSVTHSYATTLGNISFSVRLAGDMIRDGDLEQARAAIHQANHDLTHESEEGAPPFKGLFYDAAWPMTERHASDLLRGISTQEMQEAIMETIDAYVLPLRPLADEFMSAVEQLKAYADSEQWNPALNLCERISRELRPSLGDAIKLRNTELQESAYRKPTPEEPPHVSQLRDAYRRLMTSE